jgi:hypothetical protein
MMKLTTLLLLSSLLFTISADDVGTLGPVTRTDDPANSPLVRLDDADPSPDPNSVYVDSISYGGSGCPNGSVGQSISPDRKSFTLIFDKYVAYLDGERPPVDARKNCQLSIQMKVPVGWSFAVATVTFRGFAQLSAKLRATQKSIYYFQGELAQVSAGTDLMGPLEGKDYVSSDTIPMETNVWSDCKAIRPLNINTQVRVERLAGAAPDARGQMTTDSIDGKVVQKLALVWKKC